jgi:hypothetical protein
MVFAWLNNWLQTKQKKVQKWSAPNFCGLKSLYKSLGGGAKGQGVTLFSAKGKGYHFFQIERKKIVSFEHFGALLGQTRHENAQKWLKQAVWDYLSSF